MYTIAQEMMARDQTWNNVTEIFWCQIHVVSLFGELNEDDHTWQLLRLIVHSKEGAL